MIKKYSVFGLALLCLLLSSVAYGQTPRVQRAKNVIIMIPDGTGLFDITAARIKKNGISGAPLALETLDRVGYVRTYSADNTVTDSSAAASAYACGEKFKNGTVCLHPDGKAHNPSLLEIAKRRGMSTALVATSTITHATPASFGSHVKHRSCETEIARQFIELTRPDILLGGGASKFKTETPDKCGTKGDFVAKAQASGYTVVTNGAELQGAVAKKPKRLLGLFAPEGLTPEYKRTPNTVEPRLPEMARAALNLLEKNPKGFFTMIEGSQVDWGNHDNNLPYQIGELLAFDEAVKVVLDWINADPKRKRETLLIITPDHETGGFVIRGDENVPALGAFSAGWNTKGHTGGDVVCWSQGPGSEHLGAAIQNIDIYKIAKQAIEAAR